MTAGYDLIAEKLAARGDDIARVEAALRAQAGRDAVVGVRQLRARVSRCSRSPACRATRSRSSRTPPRCTGSPGSRRRSRCTSRGTRSTTSTRCARRAAELGLRLGAINPNLFQEPEYKLGSLCNPDAGVRRRAVDHVRECIEIAGRIGSDAISLWLADGTNYPGPGLAARAPRAARRVAARGLRRARRDEMELLVEYKLYEPAFYATDLADWGSALLVCQELGERAKVLVDLGHHAQGVNIEQIVSLLHGAGRLGGFHFNDRKYGDDDLIVGSIDPFQLFRIFFELVDERRARERRRGSRSTSRTTSSRRSRR